MRTSTWDQDWVYGLYESASAADTFIHEAEAAGVKKEDMAVLTPEALQDHRFEDMMPEERHPEWRVVLVCGIIGFVVGNVVGHVLMHTLVTGFGWLATMLIAMLPGVCCAVAGAFFGIQFSGADASLNELYEDSGEGKVMVAVKCSTKHPERTDQLEKLFLKTGVKPVEFPDTHLH